MYDGFLFNLFNNSLNRKRINIFYDDYIVLLTTNKGKSNERICITPGMKWYVKQHIKKHLLKKKEITAEKKAVD